MSGVDLTRMSYEELIQRQRGFKTDAHGYLDVEKEFARRDKLDQRNFELTIYNEQSKTTRISIVAGVVATLVAAIVGAWAQGALMKQPEQNIKVTVQLQTSSAQLAHYKVKNVKVSK